VGVHTEQALLEKAVKVVHAAVETQVLDQKTEKPVQGECHGRDDIQGDHAGQGGNWVQQPGDLQAEERQQGQKSQQVVLRLAERPAQAVCQRPASGPHGPGPINDRTQGADPAAEEPAQDQGQEQQTQGPQQA
ncbi:hypothetical protein RZS08_41380, partial [Arthrospira platensis SPKY1]|nr:hypothetical protein [Arthrospira platensis SPKY1]